MLYFIQNSTTNAIKIGISANPIKRLQQLQTANGSELQLLHTIDCSDTPHGDRGCENRLHGILKLNRVRGEWFKLHPEAIQWLTTLTCGRELYH